MTDRPPIFLSYARGDHGRAVDLVETMQRVVPAVAVRGHPPVVGGALPVQDTGVAAAVDEACFVALMWSVNSAGCDEVRRTLDHAAGAGSLIVPITIKVDGSSPPELPEMIGRNLLGLRLGSDPSPERLAEVAAKLSAVADHLATADPDAAFPGYRSTSDPSFM